MFPACPPNELSRLCALRSYDILDTEPEPAFDEIVRLATHLCGTPIGVISLTDADRQWFKANVGLAADELERDLSFCGHCILGEQPLIVPDAITDPRFADNPYVVGGPGLRFYAGFPLRGSDDLALGTLCVLDIVPRELDALQLEAMGVLSRVVVTHLELRRSLARLARAEGEQRRLAGDLGRAITRLTHLNGLLPMCAWCQRIRNEELQTWQPLDLYVAQHSRVTHGICPDCSRKQLSQVGDAGPTRELAPPPAEHASAVPWQPAHERERLAAVAESQLGGTLPEKCFDDLTLLASELCHTPLAALNLVEEHRLWTKSSIGMEGQEVPRETGFCSWTILQPGQQPLIVPDLQADARFRHNPLVAGGPHLRFYAGVTVCTADGYNVGALCVLDHVPRELDRGQIEALLALARQAALQIDLRRGLGAIASGRESDALHLLQDGALADASPDLHAQRLEVVGSLAANVAHDFANLVTLIMGHADWLAGGERSEAVVRSGLQQIAKASSRAAELTRRLLDFSRADEVAPEPLALAPFLAELRSTLRRLTREDIRVALEAGPGIGYVRVAAARLEQIFLNLLRNAQDAMPGGGAIAIRAEAAGDPGHRVVEITFADSGAGMDEPTRRNLFRPFFTTKAAGRGTGLGLSAIYGIVRQAGGTIQVESEPGRGARFRIVLPLCAPAPEPALAPGRDEGSRGSERILLAEDDAQVRAVIATGLRRLGYRVSAVASPASALRTARRMPDLRILVTDVVMPRMGGEQLASRLRAVLPDLRTVFITGYPDELARLTQAGATAGHAVLGKPLRIEQLARRVRELLDAPGPEASDGA